MNRIVFSILCILLIFAAPACNKDDVIGAPDGKLPVIDPLGDEGVYVVKTGGTLEIAPVFEGVDDMSAIVWTLDDREVARGPVFTRQWLERGEFYLTVSASNRAGTATADIRVDVIDMMPPRITLNEPEGGFVTAPGVALVISPVIASDEDSGELHIEWTIDGEAAGDSETLSFMATEEGVYNISLTATNDDGTASREFTVTVTRRSAMRLSFAQQSYFMTSTTRYTFAGRPVILCPEFSGFANPVFSWTVDGVDVGCSDEVYIYTPERPSTAQVAVTVSDGDESMTATVTVVCVDATESSRRRAVTASSRRDADRVYEYVPAPGQFIGETSVSGMPGQGSVHDEACAWALRRLDSRLTVSLGSFGGYIIAGFDHSVATGGADYDLAVGGNAFVSARDGSNEPGIVWVSQDVNGNGLPDDEWYELAASETGKPTTIANFAVTYYRPDGLAMSVGWTASDGTSGTVDYLPSFHRQDSYYPGWIDAASYTLRGTRITPDSSFNPATGYWANMPLPWGYADNAGTDGVGSTSGAGTDQKTGLRIANAIMADGSPIALEYVDFVKVQTGPLAKCGPLGEVSTEVTSISDFHINP